MELRVLKYFVEVARTRNISRAAENLYVSQPAISKQLQLLEDELGVELFSKVNRGIQLTAAGIRFLQRAEDLLELENKTKNEFANFNRELTGNIYIGGAESHTFKFVAQAVKNFREKYSDVQFHIYSGNNEDIERLNSGLLDFVLTIQSVDFEIFDFIKLPVSDIWGVIMRKDSSLAAKEKINIHDLKNLPLIMSREAMTEEYPKFFSTQLNKMKIAATFNLSYNAAMLARAGIGYLIGIGGLINDAELCFRPLTPELKSDVYFIWKKYRQFSPAAEFFLSEMKNLYDKPSACSIQCQLRR